MRITIAQGAFLPVPPLRGGAIEKAWHALGREFAARGHEVTHLSRRCDGLPERSVENGVRHIRIRGFDTPSRLWWLKALDLAYSLNLLRVLPPADILVTHTFFLPILARSRRGSGRLYVHVGRTPRGQMRLYRHAAALQVPSGPIADAVRRELGPVHPLVPVIGYPVVLPEPVTAPERVPGRILYLGRLHPEKGLSLLVEAFARLHASRPLATLRIVGPWDVPAGGAGEGFVRQLRDAAGPAAAAVSFTGPLYEPAALATEIRSACLFAYPSLAETGETFGLSALEAMAGGTPPVVSALGCFGDFVRDGENGFIFDHSRGAAALEEAFLRAADCLEPGGAPALRKAAVETASRYTASALAERHLEDFHRILSHA